MNLRGARSQDKFTYWQSVAM